MKLVAGRIIPAVATTTASVTGLVMLELFKVVLKKPATSMRTRLIGLAVNNYTSFEADEPKVFKSGTLVEKPAATDVPPEAFDGDGNIKEEYWTKEDYAAYPEGHSIWDKIAVPSGSMTLSGFRDWLREEHGLRLNTWNFVLGFREVEDEGKKCKVPVSAPVYPPPPTFDYGLLPPLTDSQGDAMRKLMGSPAIPQAMKMKYLQEWQKAKAAGRLPEAGAGGDPEAIGEGTSLKGICEIMGRKAEKSLQMGALKEKSISSLAGRKFWVIPADQTPSCSTIPKEEGAEGRDVKYMASLKIPLE